MKKLLFFIACLAGGFSNAQSFTKAIGGSGNDVGRSVVTDASGNIYSTGAFSGTVDFDPGSGTTNATAVGSTDVFITKFDAAGNLLWVQTFGGSGADVGLTICLDRLGSLYVGGVYLSTVDFDPGAGTLNKTSVGFQDAFLVKYGVDGTFAWANTWGGTNNDGILGLASDATGNIYAAGAFSSTSCDFDPGAGTTAKGTTGNWDISVSKFDGSGNFAWVKTVGGTNNDQCSSIALDPSGNILLTGWFALSVDFDPGAGTNTITSVGNTDAFVLKLDASGDFVYAKSFGSANVENGYGIVCDADGNTIVSGGYNLTVDFDPGAGTTNLTAAGSSDIFVVKLDANGNLIWAKSMGGTAADFPYSVATDPWGNVYTIGYFTGTGDFDPGAAAYSLTSAGGNDIFVSKLDGSGNFVWALSLGGSGSDIGFGITTNTVGAPHFTGSFSNTVDMDPGTPVANLVSAGGTDIFINHYSATGTLPLRFVKFTAIAEKEGNHLQWQTTDETNTKNFSVEKSSNGSSFYAIGLVQAKGSGGSTYDFTDASQSVGIVYYRLRITDNDGRFTHSATTKLSREQTSFVNVYPNPAFNFITVSFTNSALLNSTVFITDVQGKKIKTFALIANGQQLPVNDLPKGTYFLQLKDGTTVKLAKN